MTAAAPWSVKGINPKAREVAKDLARRSGMTLGEWLNRVILEDDIPDEVTSEDHFGTWSRRAPAPETATPKSRMAETPRSQDPDLRYRPDEFGRIAFALDRLTDRIEASETRTGLAISGVEHSVRHAMAKIEAAEREHMATAARVDAAAERLDAEQARVAERLRRMEAESSGPRSAEALRLLESRVARVETGAAGDPAELVETVVARLGERLSLAEGRTSDALESLRGSLAELDARMGAGGATDFDQRFEALAEQLTRKVEAARAEIAERLAAAGAGNVEAQLGAMAAQLAGAEQRSARAIETMGREVLTMAETLNRRVHSAEQRSAEAIEQVGGEIARIAGAVESRLSRTDQLHAEALERLGTEIGRITERLTDRIIQSERRAAQAIDDVGEQVSKVTERIEQRHERAASDMAERLRASEERTASLLEAARLRLDEHGSPALPPQAEPEVAADIHADATSPAEPVLEEAPSIFGADLMARAELISQPALDPGNPAFGEEDFEAADRFAPIAEAPEEAAAAGEAEVEAAQAEAPAAPLSTREVIEQARAAARAAAGPRAKTISPPADRRARVARTGLFAAFRPSHATSTWQTALMVAGGAAFLSVGAAGVVLLEGPGSGHEAPITLPFSYEPRASVALAAPDSPAPADASRQVAADTATPAPSTATAEFVATTKAVEQRTPGALARLKTMAEADYTPAQLYLAKLYENGSDGVSSNLSEARRWTARAADAGDPVAMHNLALYYFHGDGGVKDPTQAARWFRKAAERGVVDSQYNLAMLYQSGSGVPRDLAEAYKWFQIAATGGDGPSRSAAISLEPKLSSAQIATAEAAVDEFAPTTEGPRPAMVQATPGAVSPAAAKKILARLGYIKGAGDLTLAVAAYQRDQGLAATGALDPATMSRLAVFNR